jgi:hypothetical protein
MNLQPIWQLPQDPARAIVVLTALGLVLTALGLVAAGINFLVIKPVRNWLARKQAEKVVVRNLLRFLENRRVLYSGFAEEHVSEVINSVHQIRNRLGEDIERLDEDSKAARTVREMQGACRNFLSRIASLPKVSEGQIMYFEWQHTEVFILALVELRTIFDSRTDELYEKYGIKRGERLPEWGPMGAPYRSESRRFYVPGPEEDEETH